MRKMVGQACLGLACLAATLAAPADARRGGSFGSRGARTYYSPRATRLAPGETAPVARSMTARPDGQTPAYAPSPSYRSNYAPGYRPRFGFGGGLLAGLVTGGLIGGLLGHGGYGGGGGGMLPFLIQLAVIGGLIWLGLRLFRRSTPAQPSFGAPSGRAETFARPFTAAPAPDAGIAITPADQEEFERLLLELQDAFGHEDYGRLRAITTPEVMSYLAEELGDNATHGRRNDVIATRLIDGEVSEAWREDAADYATIAMRYESIDVTRDRASGAVLTGDAARPTETTELWTFVRSPGAAWKVSAIQEM